MVHLIIYEEAYVIQLCGHFHIKRFALLFPYVGELGAACVLDFLANPPFIFAGMVAAVHSWEQHVLDEAVLLVVVDDFVLVRVRCVFLLHTHINRAGLYRQSLAVPVPVDLGIKAFTVEEWA